MNAASVPHDKHTIRWRRFYLSISERFAQFDDRIQIGSSSHASLGFHVRHRDNAHILPFQIGSHCFVLRDGGIEHMVCTGIQQQGGLMEVKPHTAAGVQAVDNGFQLSSDIESVDG